MHAHFNDKGKTESLELPIKSKRYPKGQFYSIDFACLHQTNTSTEFLRAIRWVPASHTNRAEPRPLSDVQDFLRANVAKASECTLLDGNSAFVRRRNLFVEGLARQSSSDTILAFHGSTEDAITNILEHGFDVSKRGSRCGQHFGPGEYFGATVAASAGYMVGQQMLLVELPRACVSEHDGGTILTCSDPACELPRALITF